MTVSVLLVILYRAFFWFAMGVEKNIRILTKKLFPLTHYYMKALLFLWQRTAPPKIKNAPPPNRNCTPLTGFYQNYGSLPKSPVNKRVFWTFFLLVCSKSAQNYGKNRPFFGKNKAISGILAYSNRKNQFFLPSFEISVHLLLKFTDSGSAIPLTIAFAEDSFEV